MSKTKQLFSSLGTALLAAGVILFFLPGWVALCIMAVLILHELAHYTAAKYLDLTPYLPLFVPVGVGAIGATYIKEDLHPIEEMIIGIAGPLLGLIISAGIIVTSIVLSNHALLIVGSLLASSEIFNLTIGFDAVHIRKGIKFLRT